MSNNSMETCFAANSSISTRDDDLVIGNQRAAVYVRNTQNIVFGNGDMQYGQKTYPTR